MEKQIADLVDPIYRDKVLRARKLSVGERMATGIELFEQALQIMRSGIRLQFPDADDAAVEEILKQRLKRLKQVNEHGIYQPAPN
ncbi:MAG: hypothetical protein O3C21_04900 [Verrucomicrobia bacterium]|nr:hypothetical protein [Verrucomicrobiota bacterium]